MEGEIFSKYLLIPQLSLKTLVRDVCDVLQIRNTSHMYEQANFSHVLTKLVLVVGSFMSSSFIIGFFCNFGRFSRTEFEHVSMYRMLECFFGKFDAQVFSSNR